MARSRKEKEQAMFATLKSIVGASVRRADFFLQSRLCLVQPLFIEDPAAVPGAGIYTAEDWSRVRPLRTAPFAPDVDRHGSDQDYRQYLSSIHQGKILSVQSLIRAFDFSRYRRIMELGCGDMPQAYRICSRYPDISYTATDFDPYVIERCSRLPLLAGIRKKVFDVMQDDLAELKNHDLVVSWSLEFSLDDAHLGNLFAACKKHCVPYLLCTHTTIGPLDYLFRAWSLRKLTKRVRSKGVRMLGWLRSVGEIARLARRSGMRLQWKSYHVNHAALLFAP
jgi:hypothetical protein